MKLIRFGSVENEKPGVLTTDNQHLDVSKFGEDYDESFFGTDGINRLQTWLASNADLCPKISSDTRLGPPVCRPSKIICVGLNYAKHAKESGMELPAEPVIFYKSTSAIIGPADDIIIPKGSLKTDWEVELAVVIGQKASYVEEAEAMNHVAGYMVHNDVSERAFQLERSGQWLKGKGSDTFAPIGPWMVTKDEISDPHKLDLWLKVNDELLQSSDTSDLVFDIPHIISYISQFMTLLPGDVISTGTPSGVGMGLNPPRYLKDGDVVELGIEGLGVSKQKVRSYQAS